MPWICTSRAAKISSTVPRMTPMTRRRGWGALRRNRRRSGERTPPAGRAPRAAAAAAPFPGTARRRAAPACPVERRAASAERGRCPRRRRAAADGRRGSLGLRSRGVLNGGRSPLCGALSRWCGPVPCRSFARPVRVTGDPAALQVEELGFGSGAHAQLLGRLGDRLGRLGLHDPLPQGLLLLAEFAVLLLQRRDLEGVL